MFVLIEGELRSLIRNCLEKVIGLRFEKKENKLEEIALKLSIRVVSSLFAIYIFNNIRNNQKIREYTSYIMIIVFVYFLINE